MCAALSGVAGVAGAALGLLWSGPRWQQSVVGSGFAVVFGGALSSLHLSRSTHRDLIRAGASGALCHSVCWPEQIEIGVSGKVWTQGFTHEQDTERFYTELSRRIAALAPSPTHSRAPPAPPAAHSI